MTTIKQEPAMVYRATVKLKNGNVVSKRFFVRRAAIEWAARRLIKAHCTCEEWTFEEPGYNCQYHDGSDYAERVRARLVRAIEARNRREWTGN